MCFRCDTCGATFVQVKSRLRHQRTAHGGSAYDCDRCGMSFKRKDALARHMKRHAQDKSHECKGCGKRFHRKDKCEEHQVVCFADRQDEEERKRQAEEHIEEPPQKKMKVDPQVGGGRDENSTQTDEPATDNGDPCQMTTALDSSLKELEFKPRQRQTR